MSALTPDDRRDVGASPTVYREYYRLGLPSPAKRAAWLAKGVGPGGASRSALLEIMRAGYIISESAAQSPLSAHRSDEDTQSAIGKAIRDGPAQACEGVDGVT